MGKKEDKLCTGRIQDDFPFRAGPLFYIKEGFSKMSLQQDTHFSSHSFWANAQYFMNEMFLISKKCHQRAMQTYKIKFRVASRPPKKLHSVWWDILLNCGAIHWLVIIYTLFFTTGSNKWIIYLHYKQGNEMQNSEILPAKHACVSRLTKIMYHDYFQSSRHHWHCSECE